MSAELMPLREALALLIQLAYARERVLATKVFYGDAQTDPSVAADRAEYDKLQAAVLTVETFARSQAATVDPAQIRML